MFCWVFFLHKFFLIFVLFHFLCRSFLFVLCLCIIVHLLCSNFKHKQILALIVKENTCSLTNVISFQSRTSKTTPLLWRIIRHQRTPWTFCACLLTTNQIQLSVWILCLKLNRFVLCWYFLWYLKKNWDRYFYIISLRVIWLKTVWTQTWFVIKKSSYDIFAVNILAAGILLR